MSILSCEHAHFKVNDNLVCTIDNLALKAGELLVLLGANASGKSTIARALAGDFTCIKGRCTRKDNIVSTLVSFEQQGRLFEEDFKYRNSDVISDEELEGIKVSSILSHCNQDYVADVMELFGIGHLYDRALHNLSSGEGRKILIVEAICARRDLIILDTPFDALDTSSRARLVDIIEYIHKNTDAAVVLIVNRKDEIPSCADKFGFISSLSLKETGGRELMAGSDFKSLLDIVSLPEITIPKPPYKYTLQPLSSDILVSLKNINITYKRPVFTNFSFEIRKGCHYQISGPNGCGKSTLISLVTGDNPLVYTNDVTVFGYKRGSGESIWDIKKYFGIVSGALHLDYRVSSSVINVILSGFHDSIGLYDQVSDEEIKCARAWLALAGLENMQRVSFKELSFGQQQLVLIIRALVKVPPLLILDEPLQGLDTYGRELVKEFVSVIMEKSDTTVIFVSHHSEDAPRGIKYNLTFKSYGDGYIIEDDRER